MNLNPTLERRHFLFLLLVLWLAGMGWSVSRVQPPAPSQGAIPARPAGHVLDQGQILSPQAASELETAVHDSRITVVSIKSMGDYHESSIEALAERWHQAWQLGDEGVLLLLSPGDRKARIELGPGFAPEARGRTDFIMSNVIVPAAKKGDYATALLEGSRKLAAEPLPTRGSSEAGGTFRTIILGVAALLVLAGLTVKAGPAPRTLIVGTGALMVALLYLDYSYLKYFFYLWSAALMAAAFQPEQSGGHAAVGGVASLFLVAFTLPEAATVAGVTLGMSMFLALPVMFFAIPIYLFTKVLGVMPSTSGSRGSDSASDWSSSSDSSSYDSSSSSYDSGGSSSYDSGGGGSSDSGSTGSW